MAQSSARPACSYAGIGNIAGVLAGGERSRGLVSHNGTVGVQIRQGPAFDYAWPPRGLLVMHSDGLTSRWSLDTYPGLRARHPAVIAGVLYRDFAAAATTRRSWSSAGRWRARLHG